MDSVSPYSRSDVNDIARSSVKDINEFLRKLSHCGIEPEDIGSGLATIGSLIEAKEVDFITFNTDTNKVVGHWHTHSSSIRDWLYRWPHGVFRFQPLQDALSYRSLHISTFANSLELRHLEAPTALERAYLSCLGISDYCTLSFNSERSIRSVFIFSRGHIDPSFNAMDIRRLEQHAVSIKHAVNSHIDNADIQAQRRELESSFSNSTQPCAVFLPNQTLLYASDSFKALCQDIDSVRVNRAGKLVVEDQELADRIDQTTSSLVNTSEHSPLLAQRILTLPRDGGDASAVLTSISHLNSPAVMVEILEGQVLPELCITDITDNLRATVAEAKLCLEVVKSGDFIDAAQQCKMTLKNAELFLNSLLTRNKLKNIKELQQQVFQLFA